MKKAIVLLTSLFFITIISLLIIKNLDVTTSYIEDSTKDSSYTQAFILIENISEQIVNIKNINEIKELYLDDEKYVHFNLNNKSLKDINIELKLKIASNESININEFSTLSNRDSKKYYKLKEKLQVLLLNNDVNDVDSFEELILSEKDYTNVQQIQKLLLTFIDNTEDENILKIKDNFFYKDIDDSYLFCKIQIKQFKSKINAKLLLNTKEKKVNMK